MSVMSLTTYATSTNSLVLGTARQLQPTAASPTLAALATRLGTATGFGQAPSQGNVVSAWPAYSAIQSPNGGGFLLENGTLDLSGQQFPAGNWTPQFRAKVSIGSIVADLWCPVYVYNTASGLYTPIGSPLELAAQSISTSPANYTFTAGSLPLANMPTAAFVLYWEVWFNVTANSTGSSTANLSIFEASSSTQGNSASDCWLVTPGYQPIPASGGITAFGTPRRASWRGGRRSGRA